MERTDILPVETLQQSELVQRLKDITMDYTVRPANIPKQPFQLE